MGSDIVAWREIPNYHSNRRELMKKIVDHVKSVHKIETFPADLMAKIKKAIKNRLFPSFNLRLFPGIFTRSVDPKVNFNVKNRWPWHSSVLWCRVLPAIYHPVEITSMSDEDGPGYGSRCVRNEWANRKSVLDRIRAIVYLVMIRGCWPSDRSAECGVNYSGRCLIQEEMRGGWLRLIFSDIFSSSTIFRFFFLIRVM